MLRWELDGGREMLRAGCVSRAPAQGKEWWEREKPGRHWHIDGIESPGKDEIIHDAVPSEDLPIWLLTSQSTGAQKPGWEVGSLLASLSLCWLTWEISGKYQPPNSALSACKGHVVII